MIQSVNRKEFETFGVAFAEKNQLSVLANGHSVALLPSETAVYETTAETWLGCETGLAVLSVSTEDGSTMDFYLDRTVRLKAGVRFALTALSGKAVVQIAGYLMPRLVQTGVSQRFETTPQLQVTRLFALLYQEKEPGYLMSGEAHPMLELTFVDGGSMHSVADGCDLLLEQGDMVFYGKNQWHTQHADKSVAPKLVVISFDAEGLDTEALCNRRFRSSQKAVYLLQQMLREQERMDAFSGDMLISLLQALLLTLLRDEENSREMQKPVQYLTSENQVIRQAQQYIADHVEEKLTVPKVAQSIHVSASYLTALFHKHLQIPPGEYIRRTKLQKSKQMIRQGELNFTQIAKALDYSTIYHFSRQFKQMFDITPSEYAKSVK